MNILRNKKGMGLPMVLGITVFVIGLAATLMSYIVFQAKLVQIDIDQTEDYHNAVSDVSAVLNIISREQNLDPLYLRQLETYFNITIENYNENVLIVTSMINENNQVISYMTGSIQEVSTIETIFEFTGTETNFDLSPLVTPENLLSEYIPEYLENTFDFIDTETEFTSFDDIMAYIEALTIEGSTFIEKSESDLTNMSEPYVNSYWYIDEPVNLVHSNKKNYRNLGVADGKILFINGDLDLSKGTTLTGNIVINGNLDLTSGNYNGYSNLQGTFYVNGDVTLPNSLNLGTVERPTFVFATGHIELSNWTDGVGYFLSDSFEGQEGQITIQGGVYSAEKPKLSPRPIESNPDLDESILYDYAIPTQIPIESTGETPPGEVTTTFKFTYPKLN